MFTRTLTRFLPRLQVASSAPVRTRPAVFAAAQRMFSAQPAVTPLSTPNMTVKSESEILREIEFNISTADITYENKAFRSTINQLFKKHRPSRHAFFSNLKNASPAVVTNPGFLREFYKRYQAAMHATRVMVYMAPHLSHPNLRQRKIRVLLDDDAVNGLSHHRQLENMFKKFGASISPELDTIFGDCEELAKVLDPATSQFVNTVIDLYPKSTGAWCIAEVLSDDWLSSLADSFSPFYPTVFKEQYFDEVFSGHVETQHMLETVGLTEDVLARYPHKLDSTCQHAAQMAQNLDGLWDNLNELVTRPESFLTR